jgi:hypothetical protein
MKLFLEEDWDWTLKNFDKNQKKYSMSHFALILSFCIIYYPPIKTFRFGKHLRVCQSWTFWWVEVSFSKETKHGGTNIFTKTEKMINVVQQVFIIQIKYVGKEIEIFFTTTKNCKNIFIREKISKILIDPLI